jgi:cell division protein FtsW (lipid II flippase)
MYQKFFSKITKDLLAALIATYFILLIPELVLPGIVSDHFNPKYLLIFILLLGLAYSKFGTKTKKLENPKFRAISRNLINIILFVIAIMLILSLYKMKIWEIAIVIAISIPLLVSAENILIKE